MNYLKPRFNVGFILAGVLTLLILSGCNQNQESLIRQFTPPEDEAIATNYISLLRQNKYDPILKAFDPSLKSAITKDTLVKMADAIPKQDPISVKVVGARQFRNDDIYQINLTFEYQFSTNWMVINVMTQKKGNVSTIIGFHVHDFGDSLENLNKFTLAGKSLLQYATFSFAIVIPIFVLCALVICFWTKMQKRKWLWLLFILFGIGQFTVNWTTNRWSFALLHFQLFGTGCFASPYDAWFISISVPLGAIVFFLRRKTFGAPVTPPSSIPPTP